MTAQAVHEGKLSELAPLLDGVQPVLVMAAEHCGSRLVEFADHERRLLQKIIPFALEEELTDRVDDLHFVIAAPDKTRPGEQNVMAAWFVSKSRLADELAWLHDHQVEPSACIPEQELVPWQADQWIIVVKKVIKTKADVSDTLQCLVKFNTFESLTCGVVNLGYALALLVKERQVPTRILLVNCAEEDCNVDAGQLKALPGLSETRIETKANELSSLLLAGFEQSSGHKSVNLLVGKFAPRLPWGRWWQQWRVAAILLLAVGLADVATRVIKTRQLAATTRQLTEQTEATFRQVIPDGVMVDALLQLERRLAALQGNSANGFVALLNRAAPVIMNNPQLEVQNLDYSEGDQEIRMTLITRDFNTAESVRTRLQALGLRAELTGSASSADGSRSSLSISRG